MKKDKVLVACPQCGHKQPESRKAYSTVCQQCRQYFRVQDVLHPSPPAVAPTRPTRAIQCFQCGHPLVVPTTAQSTMCKSCGSHVDLHDYRITNSVAKNFRTKGQFVIEPGGFLFNTDTIAGDVVIKGRLLGKLAAEGSLEIHSSAQIKGSLRAELLIIPPGHFFRWPEPLPVTAAKLGGELVADLQATGTVALLSTARFFGRIQARHIVVESGAVWVGPAHVGPPPETGAAPTNPEIRSSR